MIVCVCKSVSDKTISRAVSDGARTFEDLQIDLGVALQCGKCEPCARGLMDTALRDLGEFSLAGGECAPDLHGLDCAACDPRPAGRTQMDIPAPGQLNLASWATPIGAASRSAEEQPDASAKSANALRPRRGPPQAA